MSTIKEIAKAKYSEAALRIGEGKETAAGASALDGYDPITSDLCDSAQASGLREKAVAASLGCGNPTARAELKARETVLDRARAGASMCCSRQSVSARQERPTAST